MREQKKEEYKMILAFTNAIDREELLKSKYEEYMDQPCSKETAALLKKYANECRMHLKWLREKKAKLDV